MNDINKKYILTKTIECPICKKKTIQSGLRSSVLKVESQDIDLNVKYKDIEPLLYGVYFCNHCGYANLSQTFDNPKERKFVYNNLFKEKWKQREIPEIHSLDYAINLYKLVLLNKISIAKKMNGEIAIVCLKLYYLYKIKNDEKEMKKFRKLCLENLKEGYEKEDFPFGGIYNNYMVSYLISIFSFFENDIDICKQWLSSLIKDINAPYKLKEKARDFKEQYL